MYFCEKKIAAKVKVCNFLLKKESTESLRGFMTLINSFDKFLTTMCQELALSSNWINEQEHTF